MAFDGITIANLAYEFKSTLEGGKIAKIAQPEKDELLIAVKNNRETYRLQISASASLPLIYLTENNKPSPLTAPNFCMLLRKHIGSARILSITQPDVHQTCYGRNGSCLCTRKLFQLYGISSFRSARLLLCRRKTCPYHNHCSLPARKVYAKTC